MVGLTNVGLHSSLEASPILLHHILLFLSFSIHLWRARRRPAGRRLGGTLTDDKEDFSSLQVQSEFDTCSFVKRGSESTSVVYEQGASGGIIRVSSHSVQICADKQFKEMNLWYKSYQVTAKRWKIETHK